VLITIHVKRVHQESVKVTFSGDRVEAIKRGPDGEFKCICGKSFALPDSVRRHAKTWDGDEVTVVATEDDERELRMAEERNEQGEEVEEAGEDTIAYDVMDIYFLEACLVNQAKDEELRGIECIVNDRMGWIVCRRCELAIVSEYLRSHLWKKHKISCSTETQHALVRSHSLKSLDDILDFRQATTVLEVPIDGIPILSGYRCLRYDHCTVRVWERTVFVSKLFVGFDFIGE
jgi:hypothetical protein